MAVGAEVLVTILILIIISFIIFLILRELVCWYWKINEAIEILRDIRDILRLSEKKITNHQNFEYDIKLKSDSAKKWYDKGCELGKLGKADEALKAYNKAIKINPDYADPWFNRACILSTKGEKERALFGLKKAIEIDDSNKEAAKIDKNFENLWNDINFKNLVD